MDLRNYNVNLCTATVSKLMRTFNLVPEPQRKLNFSAFDPYAYSFVPNIVARKFEATAPGTLFVADVS